MCPRRRLGALLALAFLAAGCKNDPAAALVGVWTVDPQATALPKLSMPAFAERAKAAMAATNLKLSHDRTFKLNFFRTLEGTWSLEGDVLTLNPQGAEPVRLTLEEGRERAKFEQTTPMGEVSVVLQKTG